MNRLTTRTIQAHTFLTVLAFGAALASVAQVPDFYGENYKTSMAFYANMGQKMNSLGASEHSIRYSSQGSTPELDLKAGSKVSVV